MRRPLRILSYTLLTLAVITLAVVGFARHLLQDQAFLKSRLSAYVLEKTGRELAVDGALQLDLGRETTLEARGIRLANAAWAEQPDMARIGHLQIVIDIPSLFGDRLLIPSLLLENSTLVLLRREDGTANWDGLRPPADPVAADAAPRKPFAVVLRDAVIRDFRLSHAGPGRAEPLQLEVTELHQQLGDDQHWQLRGAGAVAGKALSVDGWLAPARALLLGGPLEHEMNVQAGNVTLHSSGTLQDAKTGQGANIQARFSGPEMGEVLSMLGLPALTSGAFDFRLSLDSEGRMTRLDVDGDLGSLQATAEGALDRLLHPQRGQVTAAISGPDLEALGRGLGVPGLVADAYGLEARMTFEPAVVRVEAFQLKMPRDSLSVSGTLGTGPGFAGSDLDLQLSSADIGRWAPALGRTAVALGGFGFDGRLSTDAGGVAAIDGKATIDADALIVRGRLGPLSGPFQPDLDFDFTSSNPARLAALVGLKQFPAAPLAVRGKLGSVGRSLALQGVTLQLDGHHAEVEGRLNIGKNAHRFVGSRLDLRFESPNVAALGRLFEVTGLPEAPLEVRGRVSRPDQRFRFENLAWDLSGHHAQIDGYFNPQEKFSGSDITVKLDSPDLAKLALLFGEEDLPHEAMDLEVTLRSDDQGLRFRTTQGAVGDVRLEASGHVPDLKHPLKLDADFDIRLPHLTWLHFLARGEPLPDLPFSARGRLRNRPDRMELEAVRLELGESRALVSGDVMADQRFDLSVQASGANASELQPWTRRRLPPQPFALQTRLAGSAADFALTAIDARLGNSEATGNLQISRADAMRLSGQFAFEALDLTEWLAARQPGDPAVAEPAVAPQSAFVFDDTPVMWLADYGVELDFTVSVARLVLPTTELPDFELGLKLADRKLQVNPFSTRGMRGGQLSGSGVLDGSGAKPRLYLQAEGHDMRLGLAAGKDQPLDSYPATDLYLLLEGSGVTRREMASSLDGKLRVNAGPGQVASASVQLLLSDFLTELFQTLNPLAERRTYTKLDCAVIAADITAGRAAVFPVVFQTEPVTILSDGSIDLRTEEIDLAFSSKPRQGLGITAGTVINPLIKVGGTLKKPAIELDPARALVSGGTAVATAGLSIVAKSFSDRFLSSKDPCGDARKDIEKRDE